MDTHFLRRPLRLFDQIQRRVHDELVHVSGFFPEPCHAIAAYFECAELQLEKRVVARADDGEVVRHGGFRFSP